MLRFAFSLLLFVLLAEPRPLFAQVCIASAGDIGGLVFADHDLDGTRDANEPAQRGDGLVVNAYDCANTLLASAPVATNGVYRLAGIGSVQGVRLELGNLPSWMVESRAGTDALTRVRFVTGGACDIQFGVAQAGDFTGIAVPNVLATCFVEGPFTGTSASLPALVRFPFNAVGTNHQETVVATHATIGSTYGLAWQRGRQRIYAGAYYKRFTGIGPGGTDAIYVLTSSGAWQGTIKLGSLAGGAGAGADAHDFTVANGETDVRDTASHGLVGKRGLGDVEIADDDRTLYVVNLDNRRIYQLDVSSGDAALATITNSWPAPDGCGNGTHRPLGLGWHKGRLWVGSVCENATTGFVHSLDPATGVFNLELTIPLTYTREVVAETSLNAPPRPPATAATWRAWTDTTTDFFYTSTGTSGPYEIAWPQPMLSDIEFDGEDMILGFRDRFGDQSGNQALHVPVASGTTEKPSNRLYFGNAAGDILRVCRTPLGPWALESGLSGACSPQHGPLGPLANSGPGGHEFYYWDFFYLPYNFLPSTNPFTNNPATPGNLNNNYHLEITMGGLLQLPGAGHVMTTTIDPMGSFSGGILRLDNRTGSRWGVSTDDIANSQSEFDQGGLTLYQTFRGSVARPDQVDTFGKANGLGDLEAMLLPAPLQIGNRVFLDLDADGIQDPCDTPIGNITVLLYSNNTQVASTFTSPVGEYYFNVAPFSSYQVRIATGQSPLAGLVPTRREVASGTELHDSDGNPLPVPGFVVTSVLTGAPGHNDHNYDFGFTPSACIGDTVWFDRNQDGLQSGGTEAGVQGVRVYLRDASGRIATNTTSTTGFYQFCNLLPADYCVEFDLASIPSGYTPTIAGAAGTSDPTDSDANILTGKTELTTLIPGENDPTWDLGLICLPPVLVCPPDLTLECPANTTPASTGTATATSPCGCTLAVSFSDSVAPGCGTTRVITRTWTAQDECGNRATCLQTIRVQDTVAPALANVPADTQASCNAIPSPPTVTALDACDGAVTPNFGQTLTPGICPQTYTISRTWSAQDACGNPVSATQRISVSDTLAPSLLGVPAAITVECPSQPAAPVVTALDNCDTSVPVGFSEQFTPGTCPGRYTLTRTWSASDACGNTSNAVQVVTIRDTLPPTLSGVPAAENAECSSLPAPPVITASDTCDPSVPVGLIESITPGTCPGRYTLTRTWTATDDCGNQAQRAQDITVTDLTAPVLSGVPADVSVVCDAVPAPPVVTALDACDPSVPVAYSEVRTMGSCTHSYLLTRTWSASDDCLNPVTAVQVITVRDLLAPVLSGVPADITVECPDVPAAAVVTATDACDPSVPVSFSEIRTAGACTNSYLLTRTWTAQDDCFNLTNRSQIITVRDTTAPLLSAAPENVQASCDTVPPAAVLTAGDACDASVPVGFTELRAAGSCPNRYTLTRTWTASDDCGNTTSRVQVVTVSDLLAPVISGVPPDATVPCTAVPTPPTVTASDLCDAAPSVIFSSLTLPGRGEGDYSIRRTWTATDSCGNQSVQSQTLLVRDTVAPVLQNIPANQDLLCVPIPAPPQITALDNCDTTPTVTLSETTITNGVRRTWTAVDDSGNSSSASQIITTICTVAIGNFVWKDTNGDGIAQNTESGIPGLLVQLYSSSQTPGVGTPLRSMQTDPSGFYRFANLAPGCYRVYIPTPPSDCPVSTAPSDASDNRDDNDDNGSQTASGAPVTSTLICLAVGQEPTTDGDDADGDLTVDFGFYAPVRVGDFAWLDLNADGCQDVGEPGISGVPVRLFATGSNLQVGSTTTDSTGHYLFGGLPPGSYYADFDMPSDCLLSPLNAKSDDARDSDADATGITPATPFLVSGAQDLTLDAGCYRPACLGDTVWADFNNDGIPQENLASVGFPGVTVNLFRVTSGAPVFLRSTVTASVPGNLGYYEFCGLIPGTYTVVVDPAGVPPAFTIQTTPSQYTVTLQSGQFSRIHDFGFNAPSTAVSLVSFTAESTPSGVQIRWTTGSETENFGFMLYRSSTPDGARVPVNTRMIESSGSAAGSEYAYVDTAAPFGALFYWLEDLEYSGRTELHGPADVVRTRPTNPIPSLSALPLPEAASFQRDANDCLDPWIVSETGNWLLQGFVTIPVIVDLTDPAHPVELRGTILDTGERKAVYLHLPAGARIGVHLP